MLEFLREVELFSRLPSAGLQAVAALVSERSYAKGEIVFRQGEQANAVYIIRSGLMEIGRFQEDGEWKRLYCLGPRDVAGIVSFFGDLVHSTAGRAATDLLLLAVDRGQRSLLVSMPELARPLGDLRASRLRRLAEAPEQLDSLSLSELQELVSATAAHISELERQLSALQAEIQENRARLSRCQQRLAQLR